jgi:cytochrome d ubiquinol oxidase subunit I
MAEVGRMPWIVNGLMLVEQGVSVVTNVFTVSLSLVVFTLVYGALMVANIYLLLKFARRGSASQSTPEQESGAYVLAPAE